MNHQFIENAPFSEYFNIHVIFWKMKENEIKEFKDKFTNIQTLTKFRFSSNDNYYFTLQSFNKLLNKHPGIIVANDGFEIESIKKFGTNSIIFSIVHDFYNFKIAVNSLDYVDNFICHNNVYVQALLSSSVLFERVFYIPHGVRIENYVKGVQLNSRLKVISISRLVSSKGVMDFYEIDDYLVDLGVEIDWIIVGAGELERDIKTQWQNKRNIIFLNPNTSYEVSEIAKSADIFISPSIFEGYGIALLEAMACGLVPIVHKLPIGIYSSLLENSGFSLKIGDIKGFADCIIKLNNDRELLYKMSLEAKKLVIENYDLKKTAINYLNVFRNISRTKIQKISASKNITSYGIFDKSYIPNSLSLFFKIIKKKFIS